MSAAQERAERDHGDRQAEVLSAYLRGLCRRCSRG